MLAPICLFTYNRPAETKLTIQALQENLLAPLSELIIFSDGPKNQMAISRVTEVRRYLKTVKGFKSITIIESSVNKGLANSIIEGVSEIIEKHEKVIVLEDDLIASCNFLDFMNQSLDFYNENKEIKSVNGYSLSIKRNVNSVYFQTRPFPWGWATWKDRWNTEIFNKEEIRKTINSDSSILKGFKKTCGDDISRMLLNSITNKNDSWYVRWTFDHFRNNKFSAFPKYSFIQNIGHTSDGTHCKGINSYETKLIDEKITEFTFSEFTLPGKKQKKEFLKYFSIRHKIWIRIKLLRTSKGRKELIEDIKIKIRLK